MNIHTADGISVCCLPEDARCTWCGQSPEYMSECPIRNFDNYGLECVPELCDYYVEGDTDGYL